MLNPNAPLGNRHINALDVATDRIYLQLQQVWQLSLVQFIQYMEEDNDYEILPAPTMT